mgnify:CR=1 FL=1
MFNSLSVYDNLALYPLEHRLCPKNEMRDRVMRALKILSLENAVKKFPSELSGGMKLETLRDYATAGADFPRPLMSSETPASSATPRNAQRHGTGPIHLDVTRADRELCLTVTNRVAPRESADG